MFCTAKEKETRGCEGCYYENQTPEKKIERLEIIKDRLYSELKLLIYQLQLEKEKVQELEVNKWNKLE